MALVTVLGGYLIFVMLRALLPRTKSGVVAASGVAAGVSVVLASIAFTFEYAIGGDPATRRVSTVFGAMVGVHTLIGIGEGIITALTVGAVLAARPDLVYGAADLAPSVVDRRELVPTVGALVMEQRRARIGIAGVVLIGLLVAFGLAAFVSPFASSQARRLEQGRGRPRVRRDRATTASTQDSPLADYAVKNVDDEKVTKGLAGIIGVTITLRGRGRGVRRARIMRSTGAGRSRRT